MPGRGFPAHHYTAAWQCNNLVGKVHQCKPLHNNTEVCPTVLQMRHDALQSLIAVHDGEDIETLPAGDVPASNDAREAIIMDTAHILLPESNGGLIYRIPYNVGDGAKGQLNWT